MHDDSAFERQAERLAYTMERMRFDEYIRLTSDKRLLLRTNFLAGAARGFGMAVGFTLLGGMVVVLLQRLVAKNVPVLGDFLADVVRVVMERL